ncbi:MAG: hypothetical protein KJ052_01985 [Candidatus Hydrogenedentes bacterium]|nr:hypothetical protein [Candidatus Hydrogenedentota bacterium]
MTRQDSAKGGYKPRRPMLWAASGGFLLILAFLIAHGTDLPAKVHLDLDGVRVLGTAEPLTQDQWRLRYQREDGAIVARQYSGGFGWQSPTPPGHVVRIVYDPANPHSFQPVGLSYVPGAITAVLFTASLYLLLRVRKVLRR